MKEKLITLLEKSLKPIALTALWILVQCRKRNGTKENVIRFKMPGKMPINIAETKLLEAIHQSIITKHNERN